MLIYTFRTCPFLNEIKAEFPDVFIFGPLREDFATFAKKIKERKPDLIVGIARDSKSRVETKAINRFNDKQIMQGIRKDYDLHVPEDLFEPSKKTTHSFCNWTAYMISALLKQEKLNTKLVFIHVDENDLDKVTEWLKNK